MPGDCVEDSHRTRRRRAGHRIRPHEHDAHPPSGRWRSRDGHLPSSRRDCVLRFPPGRVRSWFPYRPFVGTIGVAPDAGARAVLPAGQASSWGTSTYPTFEPAPRSSCAPTWTVRSSRSATLTWPREMPRYTVQRSSVRPTSRCGSTGATLTGSASRDLPQVNTANGLGQRGARTGASGRPRPGCIQTTWPAGCDTQGRFTLAEAYRLLGAVGTVRVGQVVPPVYSALARIERRYVGGS